MASEPATGNEVTESEEGLGLNSKPYINGDDDGKEETADIEHEHENENNDHSNSNGLSLTRESTKFSELEDFAELGALNGDADSSLDGESPSEFIFTKTKRQEEEILGIIDTVKVRASSSIDMTRKQLQAIPDDLLQLSQLEYMHLEGNDISFLPDEFFKCFPRLQWLDLRNNLLARIPTVYLASHTCLRNLLLEGNRIRNLPLELGLVKSLHGLNIAGNPLEFPPQEIIEKGTSYILIFLVQMIEAKNTANMGELELELSSEVPDGVELISASSDDWNTTASMMDLAKRRQLLKNKNANSQAEATSLGTKSVELHRPASYTEHRNTHIEKLKKAGAFGGVVERKKPKKTSKMNWKVNPYPEPPPQDYITYKMNEEKQFARVKELKEKTDAILQRRKDDANLKSWRDEAKVLQRQKYSQDLVPGEDYDETAEKAPFAVEKDMMKVLNKEARLKEDKRKEEELRRQRAISPATKQRIEMEKQANIRELEKRIKDHTASMVERRKQPKGTPQLEMEIAKRELQIAEELHNELLAHRIEIEYRFKAYSADITNIRPRKKT